MNAYPKRLIEVDLPIARISAHARREKSIRHGHISTLHIWWARRPLAACRSVLCAALWPDPVDLTAWAERDDIRQDEVHAGGGAITIRPGRFLDTARRLMTLWAQERLGKASQESYARLVAIQKDPKRLDDPEELRHLLLDFIADFANWDNATDKDYLHTARTLTQAAHEALGGEPGTRPMVVDPFAGGGSIPLEALRVGADAFASDLNPVAVLLNKVVLEYIPKYGQRLADEVRKWGQWVKEQAEKELAEFYPKDPDGAIPIAYLWARTIACEGPGCGAEVPLMRSLWLAKKGGRAVALRLIPDKFQKRVGFEIIENARAKDVVDGTVRRGSATCPMCGYTTPVARVREQLKARRGGAADARLLCVVTTRPGAQGRFYRLPTESDLQAMRKAEEELEKRKQAHIGPLSLVPDENISLNEIRRISVPLYGMVTWGDLFTPRQVLALIMLARRRDELLTQQPPTDLAKAVQTCLALIVDRQANTLTSLSRWDSSRENTQGVFSRQAIGMVWDFAEANPFSGATGDWDGAVEWVEKVCRSGALMHSAVGHAAMTSATVHPLPDHAVNAFVTDPPYYDAVPYAYLSDFFYVWLRRSMAHAHPDLFTEPLAPKDAEIVVDRPHELSHSTHDVAFYERELTRAFASGCRILRTDGIDIVVFASKTTASWEAILQAVVEAGWVITGSWPIDTEMEARVAAQGQARLASSIHLVCRPRASSDGLLRTIDIGDWRNVLAELPKRIHEWMPRLAQEGIVGADAIFACLGPALEIFSRYSCVEKASGEAVTLREYLEHVWATVSNEALSMIFKDADAAGLEPDARLTAMWLWTLGAGRPSSTANGNGQEADDADGADEEDEANDSKAVQGSSFLLEFDAARKIAQGLGVHLEKSQTIVEIKGDKARLLPVAERTRYLFGKGATTEEAGVSGGRGRGRQKKPQQQSLFAKLEAVEAAAQGNAPGLGTDRGPQPGVTVLDRVHQAMLLFAAGRGEALKRFLVEDGIGQEARFWKLAQSLSALYPPSTDEKRWVDGVLARKKGLGL